LSLFSELGTGIANEVLLCEAGFFFIDTGTGIGIGMVWDVSK
jgi:hypothetical protein